MLIGGIQKNSFIDYPGKISCVLFLTGCNFKCPYCHNPILAKGKVNGSIDISHEQALTYLKARQDFLEGVVISGGEPTLQDDLALLCREIKDLGFPIKLDTNGSRPDALSHLIENDLVDYIAMDIKTDPYQYHDLCKYDFNPQKIVESINMIMSSNKDYEFRTTCLKPYIDDRIMQKISRLISGSKKYALQRFQKTDPLLPAFFETHDVSISEAEMMQLKTIVEPWVQSCVVR